MKFFDELKRRNVFRVAGVYAVVGWLLIQVIVAVKGPLHLPGWTDTFFVVLVLAGFPVALLLAWAFEVTPEGVKLTKDVSSEESITAKTGRKLDYAILAGFVLLAVMIVAEHFLVDARQGAGNSSKAASVAVLPFVDMSARHDEGYFSDGISEEILNVLARIPKLKVAGRTSSFSFKGKNDDLRKIGEALGVNHVLEGSVRTDGDMVRITAQLVKTEDGFHVWSETYDKKLDDIFEIQDEIARAVANQLALSLGLSEQELVPDRTKDVVAYQKYLEAKDLFHKRGRENLERALLLLHEVTARDPDFAPAWTSVASAYIVLEYYEPHETPAKTYKQWRAIGTAAAKRAIALNPNDAEAYINLAGFLIYDLKWIPAFDAFEKAQNLVGDDPDALDASAQTLLVAGYAKEAKALSLKSIAADPLVGIYHNTLGTAYFRLGDVEGQIAEFEKAISLSPDLTIVYRHLLNSYISVGRFADALPLAAEAIKRGFFAPEMLDAVKALQVAWSDDSALKSLVGRYDVSIDRDIAIKLGDEPALMSELEKGWNAPHQIDPSVMYAPTLAMSDPRWKAKVKSLGLYDLWKKRGFPAICKPVGRDDFECAGEPVKP